MHAKRPNKQVTISLDEGTIQHFKKLGQETGIRYQTLINLYLRECAASGKKLSNIWEVEPNPKSAAQRK